MIVVDQGYAGQTIDLAIGQVIELRLAENPTTGYRWLFTSNGAPACVVLADHFERPAGPPGSGGQHMWQIKGAMAGDCDIALHYARSFQKDSAVQTFALHVRVLP